MPRKLRLSVHRKNQYRQKLICLVTVKSQPLNQTDVSVSEIVPAVMKVSLPLNCFLKAHSGTVDVLQHRIKSTSVLPSGILYFNCIGIAS